MEKIEQLAIASVPVQVWNTTYDEEQAFRNGTIFPEFNRPFYVTVMDKETLTAEENLNEEQAKLLQIQKVGFMLDDLRLYLDTHENDKEALNLLKEKMKLKKKLMSEFARQFYPLTAACIEEIYRENPESQCDCWMEGRIPWEGVNC